MTSAIDSAPPAPSFRASGAMIAALMAVAAFTFAPAVDGDFVNLDDPDYVYQNPHVTAGLSAETIRWALTDYDTYYWHPLTWLSLQLDATLWKKADGEPDPWGFHLTNVVVHSVNTALLFLALRSLTGAFWRSAAVALLFAVHPLRVESVAWIAERKDVLSCGFGFLALWAYGAYVRRPSPRAYAAVLGAFTLSLLCKPTLVTLPFLFLVLDWWPLRRLTPSGRQWRPIVAEKLPLLALVVASAVLTYVGQSRAKAVMTLETFPLLPRLEHVAISYVAYLSKTVWPVDLAVYYPHPTLAYRGLGVSQVQAVESVLLLLALTAGAYWLRRRYPFFLAGWLWFLGTLVPVIGLVQVGTHAYADRFTYFPQVGILLAASWGAAELGRPWPRASLAGAAAVALVLAVLSRQQLQTWRTSETMWLHDVRTAGGSPVAVANLFLLAGQQELTASLLREACQRNPDFAEPRAQLCELLLRLGQPADAEKVGREAVTLNHRLPGAWCNLGLAEAALHHPADAIASLEKAIALQPDLAAAHTGLGDLLMARGDTERGLEELRAAVRANPRFSDGYLHLALALRSKGLLEPAAEQLEIGTRHCPAVPGIWLALGNVRREQGRRAEAAECFDRAIKLDPKLANRQPRPSDRPPGSQPAPR